MHAKLLSVCLCVCVCVALGEAPAASELLARSHFGLINLLFPSPPCLGEGGAVSRKGTNVGSGVEAERDPSVPSHWPGGREDVVLGSGRTWFCLEGPVLGSGRTWFGLEGGVRSGGVRGCRGRGAEVL